MSEMDIGARGRSIGDGPGPPPRDDGPSVHHCGPFTAVRFEGSTVLLHPTARSIVELVGEAALAFDVLFDLGASWPTTEAAVRRTRRVMVGVRRTLLGEELLGPHEAVSFQLDGRPLLRRFPEPAMWRGGVPAAEPSVRGGLIRMPGGALLVQGEATSTAAVALAFAERGTETIGRDLVTLDPGPCFSSAAWRETFPALQIWNVLKEAAPALKVCRIGPAPALVRILEAAERRPGFPALKAMARVAAEVESFDVNAPPTRRSIAEALGRYHGFAWP